MLTRDQITTLIWIRNQPNSIMNPKGKPYQLPRDIVRLMADVGLDEDNPQLTNLLHHIAYGDLKAAESLLETNPDLIGKAGQAQTPSGHMIKYVKPFELALCCCDPEMAAMIATYFERFKDGAEKRNAQAKKYEASIHLMLNQKAFDFTKIIDAIKSAKAEDIAAELLRVEDYQSEFRDTLTNFKDQFRATTIRSGLLQIRYTDVLELLACIVKNKDSFDPVQEHNEAKLQLAYIHLYGFVIRNLPAVDRMYFAQGLQMMEQFREPFRRSYDLSNAIGRFEEVCDENKTSGLGYNYYISGANGARERLDPEKELYTLRLHLGNKKNELLKVNQPKVQLKPIRNKC